MEIVAALIPARLLFVIFSSFASSHAPSCAFPDDKIESQFRTRRDLNPGPSLVSGTPSDASRLGRKGLEYSHDDRNEGTNRCGWGRGSRD